MLFEVDIEVQTKGVKSMGMENKKGVSI